MSDAKKKTGKEHIEDLRQIRETLDALTIAHCKTDDPKPDTIGKLAEARATLMAAIHSLREAFAATGAT